jgi:hypothetical protein
MTPHVLHTLYTGNSVKLSENGNRLLVTPASAALTYAYIYSRVVTAGVSSWQLEDTIRPPR